MTMRHLISSGVDPYTALSGSLAALFGERKCHAVIEMLSSQIGSIENIPVFLNMVKRKQTDLSPLYAASEMESAFRRNVSVKNGVAGKPVRLMGFGHRIYKTHDPRVKIAKNLAMQVCQIEIGERV